MRLRLQATKSPSDSKREVLGAYSELGAEGAAEKQSAPRPSTSAGHHQLGFPSPGLCRTQTRAPRAQEVGLHDSVRSRQGTSLLHPNPQLSSYPAGAALGGAPHTMGTLSRVISASSA